MAASAETPGPVPAHQARSAAERLSAWAIDTNNPEVLASAIELALMGGASRDPEDPWTVAPLAEQLSRMTGARAWPGAPVQNRARGVITGVSRLDLTLAPGEHRGVPLTMAGGEMAIVEARLKRGSEGADLDLRVFGTDGILASDVGSDTGTIDVGVYVEFWAARCIYVEVVMDNAGDVEANAVMLAPASSLIGCR